jgi:hypothetical protein
MDTNKSESIVKFKLSEIIKHLEVLRTDDIISDKNNHEIFTKINEDIELTISNLRNFNTLDNIDSVEIIQNMHETVNKIINSYNRIECDDENISYIILEKLYAFSETVIGEILYYRNYYSNDIEDYYDCGQFHNIDVYNICL